MSNPTPVPRPVPVPKPYQDEPQNNGPLIALGVAVGILLLILLLALLRGFNSGMGDSGDGHGAGGSGVNGDMSGDGGNKGDSDGREGTPSSNAGQGTPGDESAEEETEAHGEPAVEQDNSGEKQSGNSEEEKSKAANKTDEQETRQSLVDKLSGDTTDENEPDETVEESVNSGDFLGKGDAEVSFFGAKGKGSKFVYVIDHSGSMAGAPLEEAKKEMIKGLELLKDHHRFNIIFYDNQFISWKGDKLYPATAKNKKDAKQFINGISPAGGTDPEPALTVAIKAKPEYIFFLTDGEFSLNMNEICALANRNHVRINVVQFGGDSTPKSPLLQELAKRTKGDFRFINVGSLDAL